MKKSRIFIVIAISFLAIAGILANNIGKKYTGFTTLYYLNNSTYHLFHPGCLSSALTLYNPSLAYSQAVIEGFSSSIFGIYYYDPLFSYLPVYCTKF